MGGGVTPGPRVLLAGMPRSGTTWAAAALGAALGCPQRMEPFHPDKAPDAPDSAAWRFRSSTDADRRFDAVVAEAFADAPVVVKDVQGVLAVERWGAVADPAVVLLSRHPVAVAASWQRVGWLDHDRAGVVLDRLVNQPALMEAHLGGHERALARSGDPLHNVGALWGAIQRVWADQLAVHPDWVLVWHEDLCADPASRFAQLLDALGAPLSEVGDAILDAFVGHYDDDLGPDADPFSISRRTAAEPAKAEAGLPPDDARRVLAAAESFEAAPLAP